MNPVLDHYVQIEEQFNLNVDKRKQVSSSQYFTSIEIAQYMTSFLSKLAKRKNIKILDPGAGIGIFAATICDYIIKNDIKIDIQYDCYEIDSYVTNLLQLNLKYFAKLMKQKQMKFIYEIHQKDFILTHKESLFENNENNSNSNIKKYDIVISNPPYSKIRHEQKIKEFFNNKLIHRSNYYPLFMLIGLDLLKKNGEFVMITPRSYCSGPYFRKFRKKFFSIFTPLAFHYFESRINVFQEHNVLQEVLITYGVKDMQNKDDLDLYSSPNLPIRNMISKTKVPRVKLFSNNGNMTLRLPTIATDKNLLDLIDGFSETVDTLELIVGNGPVVPFRHKTHLKLRYSKGRVPLIWMQNIIESEVISNNGNGKIKTRHQWIEDNEHTSSILRENRDYLMLKRFVNKESNRSLISSFYPMSTKYNKIGIENHVNYLYTANRKSMEKQFRYGLLGILNSKIYNRYYSITSGTTQVNVAWLNNLKFPPKRSIQKLGEYIILNEINIGRIEIDKYFCEIMCVNKQDFNGFL